MAAWAASTVLVASGLAWGVLAAEGSLAAWGREGREEFLGLGCPAMRASGGGELLAPYQQLKRFVALFAAVFVDRHGCGYFAAWSSWMRMVAF